MRAGNSAKFENIPKISYYPPRAEIIHQTLADWEQLTDRDLFLAIGHELAFGLRISEFAQARWNWHAEQNEYPVLDGRGQVKGGTGLVQVRALDPWFTTMKRIAVRNKWWPAKLDDALIITGTDAYRKDGLFRSVSHWLRERGWETRKTNHALRAYAGSQIAMKYGIYEAQIWLRHSTVKVTEQHYSHFVAKFKPSDLDSIPARWALAHDSHTICYTTKRSNPPSNATIEPETAKIGMEFGHQINFTNANGQKENPRFLNEIAGQKLVAGAGIEPATQGFSGSGFNFTTS